MTTFKRFRPFVSSPSWGIRDPDIGQPCGDLTLCCGGCASTSGAGAQQRHWKPASEAARANWKDREVTGPEGLFVKSHSKRNEGRRSQLQSAWRPPFGASYQMHRPSPGRKPKAAGPGWGEHQANCEA